MKLFISDLDGTLLNSRQEITDECAGMLNELIAAGMNFKVATARSIDTAGKLLAKLDLRLPIILFNGVFVYDPLAGDTFLKIICNVIPRRK